MWKQSAVINPQSQKINKNCYIQLQATKEDKRRNVDIWKRTEITYSITKPRKRIL